MGIFKAIGGALTGLASGGIPGAIAGGLSGLASSGGSSTSRTSSSSGSSTQTQFMDLSQFSPGEQSLYDQVLQNATATGLAATPEEREAQRRRLYDAIYTPAAEAATSAYTTASNNAYGAAARRGAGNNSRTATEQALRDTQLARGLGDISSQATLGAEGLVAQQEADRRAAAALEMERLNSLWNRQLATSKIVRTTSSGTTAADRTTGPDTFWQSAAEMAGNAITDENSWLRTSLFGGGGKNA